MKLSKINFTYKNNKMNSQKYLLTKRLQTQQRIQFNDTKSVKKTLDLTNNVDTTKIQDIDTICKNVSEQKREIKNNEINDTNIHIKIYDTSTISTSLIDNIVDDEIILTEEEREFLQKKDYYDIGKNSENSFTNNLDINNNLFDIQFVDSILVDKKETYDINNINGTNDTNVQLKIYDTSTISTSLIDNIVDDEIILTEEEKEILQKKVYYDIGKNSENSFTNNLDINKNLFDIQFIDSILYEYEGPFTPFNVERIRIKGIKIINNIYQSKYNYDKINCTGLGDFIRGCYFIMEFCDKYQFQPKIIFNNSISKFLQVKTHKLELIQNILQGVNFFKNNNVSTFNIQNDIILEPIKDINNIMADFVDYIVDSPSYYGNVFLFCNSYPLKNISDKNKEYMRKNLEPITEIKNMVNSILIDLQLKYKEFIVIHIRSGDSYLKNENHIFNVKYFEKLTTMIFNDIKNASNASNVSNASNASNASKNNVLIIADNNYIKLALKRVFPEFKILLKDITHFGEGIVLEEEKVKNSLIDFYLLSFSKSIFSYSCYEHGSGFSYWCAKTYDIPYVCKHVK
jgi:hypothetical protein